MKFSDYVKKKIYEPLGMSRSKIGTAKVLGNENWAKGHENDSEFDSVKFISPHIGAGGHYLSVNDMSKFVKMHLNNGIVDGKEFLIFELTGSPFLMGEEMPSDKFLQEELKVQN